MTKSQTAAVLRQLSQVHSIAHALSCHLPRQVEHEDLVQWGFLGLLRAVRRFDPGRNISLGSYARKCIRGAMIDGLRELDPIPRRLRRHLRTVEEASQRASRRFNRSVTTEEIADEMRIAPSALQEMLTAVEPFRMPISINDDEADSCFAIAHEGADPFQRCLLNQYNQMISSALQKLPDAESRVLRLRYFEECNLRDVADRVGLSVSRVTHLHKLGLQHLRKFVPRRLN